MATILVGYRDDEYGHAALEHAVSLVRSSGATLAVVNVTRNEDLHSPGFVRGHELEELRRGLIERIGAKVLIRQPVGPDTAGEILTVAEELDADLLVIGVPPRSPVGKLLMGSTAQRLLIDAQVPVLSVRPGQRLVPAA